MINLKAARINVMVSSIEHALDFYVKTLELELLNHYGEHYAEVKAPGLLIGLHPSNAKVVKGDNISIGLGVINFDDTIKSLEQKGLRFNLENDGYIRLAHFKDPDGNVLFLAENK